MWIIIIVVAVGGYSPDDAAHAGAHARPAGAAHPRAALAAAAQGLHTGTAHHLAFLAFFLERV